MVNSIFRWIMKKRIHQIELFMKYPLEVQEEWFQDLISSAQATEWGKRYGYDAICTPEDFKASVPIQDYERLKPDIERMMHGEQNILWPSPVKWFAKSSGTTSDRSKFIPVSEEALEDCHYKGGKDLLSIYCHNCPETEIFKGKSLLLGGSRTVNTIGNTIQGDLSAIILENLPFWAEYRSVPGKDIALLPDFEDKIGRIAEVAINENITSLSGVPTWNLVLAKRMMQMTGKSNLLEIWPNLELYFHGGVSFKPYQEQFKKLIPTDRMYYLENYNASEGYFAIQDCRDDPSMLLMLDYGIYFEFLPVEKLNEVNPETLDLAQVELDKNYAIIISTNGGLWRYMIGDTIKFTSLFPFRIVVTGRTKQFINTFGEELMVDNADNALKQAALETHAEIREYTAGPIYLKDDGEPGGHEWIIEFDVLPDHKEGFCKSLDKHLRAINSDYDAKRYKDMALKEPLIHFAPEGTFYRWMKTRGKLGGQNKVPRLSNDRTYLDSILQQLEADT